MSVTCAVCEDWFDMEIDEGGWLRGKKFTHLGRAWSGVCVCD